MTAATFSARPVAAQRIGLVTAWKVERAKVRRSWFLGGAVILSIFAQLLGVWNYTSNLAIMQEQGLTWFGVWAQGASLVTSIFLPILYGVILAQAGALEHQTRGWQRLASIDRAGTAVSGKMLVALELALTGMAVYLVTAVAAGLFLGFDPSQLGPYLARALCGALGAWAVGAVTLMLGTWLRTFAAIASAALGATMIGMGLTAAAPPLAAASPFALITYGLGARAAGDEFASIGSMAATAFISLIWVALSAWIMRSRVRRREW